MFVERAGRRPDGTLIQKRVPDPEQLAKAT
jgi:hypothetical protein